MTWTPGAAPTSSTTWTISVWVKKASIGEEAFICTEDSGGEVTWNNGTRIYFNSSDQLRWFEDVAGSTDADLVTNRVFRDPAAWYHLVFKWDTTNGTPGDRMKIFVNGVEETSFATDNNPDSSRASGWGTQYYSAIGQKVATGSASSGYSGVMTHFHYTDGTAYDASTFGSTNATSGIWTINTSPTVTYGTNGFFIMKNAWSGTDESPNSNNWTPLASSGTTTEDNPSNNFATFNPLLVPVSNQPSFANGNTSVTTQNAGGSYFGGTSSLGMVGGKWYCEFKASSLTGNGMVGIHGNPTEQARDGAQTGVIATGYAYMNDGQKKTAAVASSYGTSYTTANVVGVAVDLDNLKIYFARDNTWQDSGDPTSGATGTGAAFTITAADATLGEHYVFSCSDNASGASVWDVNFGNGYFGRTAVTSAEADGAGEGAFEFAPPTGYYALCTKNIKAYGG